MEILPAGPLAGSPGIELLEATVAPLGAAAATEGPPLTTPSDSGSGEGVGEGEGAYISSFGTLSGGAIRGANCGGPGHRGCRDLDNMVKIVPLAKPL